MDYPTKNFWSRWRVGPGTWKTGALSHRIRTGAPSLDGRKLRQAIPVDQEHRHQRPLPGQDLPRALREVGQPRPADPRRLPGDL